MKTLLRTLTLSAAALAALVAAPKSDAQQFRRGEAHQTFHGSPGHGGNFRGQTFRGHEFRGGEFRGRGFRGGEFRGREFRGREFRGNDWHNRGFVRSPPFFYGRRPFAPFRVYAGSRFYSYCPGPGFVYIDDLGWAFPPFPGARWFPGYVDEFGVQIDGCWR